MEVGYHLDELEVQELVQSFEEKKKFSNLIREMKRYGDFEFRADKIELLSGLKFDAIKKNGDVVTAKGVVLKVDENVIIRYVKRHLNGKLDQEDDFFVGIVVLENEDGTINQLSLRAANDEVVSTIKSDLDTELLIAAEEANEKFDQEFNFDENYVPGQLLNEEVTTEGIKGCVAGGYLFCGADCGGYPACSGSKSGINGLDNCCKKHDCCYNTYDTNGPHCYCDQNLCDCSQAQSWTIKARILVEAAFCFVC